MTLTIVPPYVYHRNNLSLRVKAYLTRELRQLVVQKCATENQTYGPLMCHLHALSFLAHKLFMELDHFCLSYSQTIYDEEKSSLKFVIPRSVSCFICPFLVPHHLIFNSGFCPAKEDEASALNDLYNLVTQLYLNYQHFPVKVVDESTQMEVKPEHLTLAQLFQQLGDHLDSIHGVSAKSPSKSVSASFDRSLLNSPGGSPLGEQLKPRKALSFQPAVDVFPIEPNPHASRDLYRSGHFAHAPHQASLSRIRSADQLEAPRSPMSPLTQGFFEHIDKEDSSPSVFRWSDPDLSQRKD